jgi:hypothetical protein
MNKYEIYVHYFGEALITISWENFANKVEVIIEALCFLSYEAIWVKFLYFLTNTFLINRTVGFTDLKQLRW